MGKQEETREEIQVRAHDQGPEKEGGGPPGREAGSGEKRMPSGDGEEGGAGGGGRQGRRETQLSHGCSGPRGVPTGPGLGGSPARSHTPESPSPGPSAHAAAPRDCQIAAPWMELL